MTKKTILFIIVAAFLGAASASLLSGAPAAAATLANFLDNLRSFFGLIPEAPAGSAATTSPAALRPRAPVAPSYAAPVEYETAVIRAVERTSPAVISIVVSKDLPIIERCPTDPFADLPPEFRQFFGREFEFSVPCERGTERREVGGGSGFIVSSDGRIVTNKHVVADTKASYTALTNDGRKFDAKVLARDPAHDIAVIKIEASGLPVVALGDSGFLRLGQTAIAIGNALGEFRNTVSVGVVSGLSRNITAQGGGSAERIEGLIQTDAAINPGNSGGPLLNLRGEVIGMNTAVVSGAQSIGFAIPINQVKQALESVRRTGRIIVPFVGVRYMLLTPEIVKREGVSAVNGALVRGDAGNPAVLPNSPAAKAGITAGDVITAINGEKIVLENSLAAVIQKYNVGDTITLDVLRGGQTLKIPLKLEERP